MCKVKSNYRELTLHNGLCKSSLIISGNKIIHDQKGRKHIVTERQFFNNFMITRITVDSKVTLTKYYVAAGTEVVSRLLDEITNEFF